MTQKSAGKRKKKLGMCKKVWRKYVGIYVDIYCIYVAHIGKKKRETFKLLFGELKFRHM